jgi:hypothetical protein
MLDELLISGYDTHPDKCKTYTLLTIFHGADLAIISKVPQCDWQTVQNKIGDGLVHESLHLTLDLIGEENASQMLDNILPLTHSLRYILRKSKELQSREW